MQLRFQNWPSMIWTTNTAILLTFAHEIFTEERLIFALLFTVVADVLSPA